MKGICKLNEEHVGEQVNQMKRKKGLKKKNEEKNIN